MLIIFQSKAAAEIIMYKEHVADLFKLLNKEMDRGVITVAEIPDIIQKLQNYIENNRQLPIALEDEDDLDDIEKKKRREFVSSSARFFPLLEMLKTAQKKQNDILWGV